VNIYLAARYSRHLEMQGYSKRLADLGHRVTSRWPWAGHEEDEASESGMGESFARNAAQIDLGDIAAAQIVINFTDGLGKGGAQRGGRHVEFGLSVALGKRVMLVGPRENVFHYLPQVEQFDSFNELLLDLAASHEPETPGVLAGLFDNTKHVGGVEAIKR
jgi:hypothetical protein